MPITELVLLYTGNIFLELAQGTRPCSVLLRAAKHGSYRGYSPLKYLERGA